MARYHLDTATIKARYRKQCKDKGVEPSKLGMKLHIQKVRALAKIQRKQFTGHAISEADIQRTGMPKRKEA